jgi:hypothetical protein
MEWTRNKRMFTITFAFHKALFIRRIIKTAMTFYLFSLDTLLFHLTFHTILALRHNLCIIIAETQSNGKRRQVCQLQAQ